MILPPVHVGLNLIFLVPDATGGLETYARQLVAALVRAAPGVRMTAFVNREAAGRSDLLPPSVERLEVPVAATSRIQWVRGEQQLLPRLARCAGVDLLHSLGGTAPGRGRFRRVVTIHDLNYKLQPDAHFGLARVGMQALVPLAAHRSHRVIAVSAATEADLIRRLRIDPAKIDVVHNGASPPARRAHTPEEELRRQYDLGDREIVLSVSAMRRHKNLARLIEAMSLIAPERRPMLVLPGYRTGYEAELESLARSLGVAEQVRLVGWVPVEDLEGLYAAAACFAFPSLAEGFGLPVLEAMARGLPVACSDRSALPEIAGSAAAYFDADDPAAIKTTLERLMSDAGERERLATAGRERARLFSWESAATKTLAVYTRAFTNRHNPTDAALSPHLQRRLRKRRRGQSP